MKTMIKITNARAIQGKRLGKNIPMSNPHISHDKSVFVMSLFNTVNLHKLLFMWTIPITTTVRSTVLLAVKFHRCFLRFCHIHISYPQMV